MHARCLLALVFSSLIAPATLAQGLAAGAPEALLEKMTGHWLMTGTIARKPTTHDVDVDRVLNLTASTSASTESH